MIQIRKNNVKLLILALINVFFLSIGHAYNNQIIILGSLFLFLGVTLFPNKQYFLPIILFYLPWAPVLKLSPGSFTFYTLVVPFVILLIIMSGIKNKMYTKENLYIPALIISYTLLMKLLNGSSIDLPYLFFCTMLLFIPIYVNKYKKYMDFETCVMYLTLGVLSACIAAKILMIFPHMKNYIDVYEWENVGLTRLSGFYGDSNFYAADILVAIASLLTIMYKSRKKIFVLLQIALIMMLLYYGMLSVSKMFIICITGIALIWLLNLVISKRSIMYKFVILFCILLVTGIAVVGNLFAEEINLYLIRFGMVSNTQSLTTGRSVLFDMYITNFLSNISNLFFGVGLSSIDLVNDKASHNTLIQIIYQFGLLGSVFIILWWRMVYSTLSNKIRLSFLGKFYFLIIIIAFFFPWLSLDMVFFDQFFYIPLLAILGKNYLTEK